MIAEIVLSIVAGMVLGYLLVTLYEKIINKRLSNSKRIISNLKSKGFDYYIDGKKFDTVKEIEDNTLKSELLTNNKSPVLDSNPPIGEVLPSPGDNITEIKENENNI